MIAAIIVASVVGYLFTGSVAAGVIVNEGEEDYVPVACLVGLFWPVVVLSIAMARASKATAKGIREREVRKQLPPARVVKS